MKFVFALSQLSNAPWRHIVLDERGVQHRLVSYYYMKDEKPELLVQHSKRSIKQ